MAIALLVSGSGQLSGPTVPSAALQEQSPAVPDPPVSVERVRALLSRPPGLVIDLPEPVLTFHVEVQGRSLLRNPPPLWSTGPVTPQPVAPFVGTPPLFTIDLLSIGQQFAAAHRKRAERLAREAAEQALRDFCATHACP
jgi:hypothetical protein